MYVTARVNPSISTDDKIMLKPLGGMTSQSHRAGTVLLTNAVIGTTLRGSIVEEHANAIRPRKTIAGWPRLRYLVSQSRWVDMQTGSPVKSAKAVYMTGTRVYYLP